MKVCTSTSFYLTSPLKTEIQSGRENFKILTSFSITVSLLSLLTHSCLQKVGTRENRAQTNQSVKLNNGKTDKSLFLSSKHWRCRNSATHQKKLATTMLEMDQYEACIQYAFKNFDLKAMFLYDRKFRELMGQDPTN